MFTKENRQPTTILLIAGFLVGAILSHYVETRPLEDTIDQKTDKINQLEANITNLEKQYEEIETSYIKLKKNTVDLADYETIINEKNELENQIDELNLQINTLAINNADKSETISSLETELDQIQNELDRLIIKYDEANNPLYVAFAVENLLVNITIQEDAYSSNSDISGTISIRYTDGTPFQGTFTLLLSKVYLNVGTKSDVFDIYGEKEYSMLTPFTLGLGSYKLSISDISLPDGENVVPNSVLRDKAIYLFVG